MHSTSDIPSIQSASSTLKRELEAIGNPWETTNGTEQPRPVFAAFSNRTVFEPRQSFVETCRNKSPLVSCIKSSKVMIEGNSMFIPLRFGRLHWGSGPTGFLEILSIVLSIEQLNISL